MTKLLIVEDDPYVLKLFQRLFGFEKYQVQSARDGEEASEKLKYFQPDLILLDIMMPKMNGLQLLQKLKSDEATKAIPVVMLSNDDDDQTIKTATDLGASGYMIKSDFTPDQVLKQVRGYLGL